MNGIPQPDAVPATAPEAPSAVRAEGLRLRQVAAIKNEMDRMVARGELAVEADGRYRPTGKFKTATPSEIDALLDRRGENGRGSLPSRRYFCRMCGGKYRRNNKRRHMEPICPSCTRSTNVEVCNPKES
jgi:hypothetical protein